MTPAETMAWWKRLCRKLTAAKETFLSRKSPFDPAAFNPPAKGPNLEGGGGGGERGKYLTKPQVGSG